MNKVYDVFADEYIDVGEIDPIAPPERYKEITSALLIKNATRWFHEAQYFYITRRFDAEELLIIPVEPIVHSLVADIDDSILKMYKKGSCPNGYIKEKEASNEDN